MKKKMHFTIMGLVVAVLALALALTGCGKTTDTSDNNQSQQENTATDSTTTSPEESESQHEATTPEAETIPAQNSDGKYVYVVDGNELTLSVNLEDFIDSDDVVDYIGIQEALGYKRGTIEDDSGNTIASAGELDHASPGSFLIRVNKSDKDQTIYIRIVAKRDSYSAGRILYNTKGNPMITYNQLVAIVYIWEYYADGEIHPTPFSGLFDEEIQNNNRSFSYFIP